MAFQPSHSPPTHESAGAWPRYDYAVQLDLSGDDPSLIVLPARGSEPLTEVPAWMTAGADLGTYQGKEESIPALYLQGLPLLVVDGLLRGLTAWHVDRKTGKTRSTSYLYAVPIPLPKAIGQGLPLLRAALGGQVRSQALWTARAALVDRMTPAQRKVAHTLLFVLGAKVELHQHGRERPRKVPVPVLRHPTKLIDPACLEAAQALADAMGPGVWDGCTRGLEAEARRRTEREAQGERPSSSSRGERGGRSASPSSGRGAWGDRRDPDDDGGGRGTRGRPQGQQRPMDDDEDFPF